MTEHTEETELRTTIRQLEDTVDDIKRAIERAEEAIARASAPRTSTRKPGRLKRSGDRS